MNGGLNGFFFSTDIESQIKIIVQSLPELKKDNEFYKNRIDKILEYVERLQPKGGQ